MDGEELTHIVAFVRKRNTVAENRQFRIGDPYRGRDLFAEKGCAACHPVTGDDQHPGPGIDEIGRRSRTMAGLAGRMWSHYPEMKALLDEASARRLVLTDDEMTDIVAFLFAVGYFDAVGDERRGRNVFEAKGCVDCHSGANPVGGGLAWLRADFTPAEFARSMWNHGPRMANSMRDAGVAWPELSPQAIVDLISYLSNTD